MNVKRVLPLVLAAALLVLAGGVVSRLSAATVRVHKAPGRILAQKKQTTAVRRVNPRLTRRLRATAWRWQVVVGHRRTHSAAPLSSVRALRFWRHHARRMIRIAGRPPHKGAWLCIHRHEGSWADSGDPYWGGLQMDRGFMRSYAPSLLLRRGWANRWTPLEQMWVAERAHRSGRGFYAWPNTARYCGLI